MYAQLGEIIFEALIGFDSYQRSLEATYAEHALIDRKPRLQRTGTGLQKIAASIAFHDDFCIPEDEIKKFEDYLNNGSVLPLIFGNGRYIGDFVIMDMSEGVSQTYPDGTYQTARLSINLQEMSADSRETREAEKKRRDAAALQGNRPVTVRGQPRAYQTPDGQLTTSTVFAISEAKKSNTLVEKLLIDAGLSENTAKLLEASIANMNKYANTMAAVLAGDTTGLYAIIAPDLPLAVGVFGNALANMQSALPISSIASLQSANVTLQNAAEGLKVASVLVFAKTILRR